MILHQLRMPGSLLNDRSCSDCLGELLERDEGMALHDMSTRFSLKRDQLRGGAVPFLF